MITQTTILRIDLFTGTVKAFRKLLAFRRLVNRDILVVNLQNKIQRKGGM